MRWRASTSEAPADIIGHEANVTSKLCEACTPYIATASALRRGGVFGRFLVQVEHLENLGHCKIIQEEKVKPYGH